MEVHQLGRGTVWLRRHFLAKLFLAPRDSGHHGADRNIQNGCNFLIAVLLEIKQGKRCAECFVQLTEEVKGAACVKFTIRVIFITRNFVLSVFQLRFRIPLGAPGVSKVFAVEGGEKPGFSFGTVFELVALLRPDAERLLDEVGSAVRAFRQRHAKPVKGLVMSIYERFKFGHRGWDRW